MTITIGAIGGEGSGPEALAQALRVLEAVEVPITVEHIDVGADQLETGEILSPQLLARLRATDAILVGAQVWFESDGHQFAFYPALRSALDLYAYERTFVSQPNAPISGLDVAIVRENTEGYYSRVGGVVRKGTPDELATQLSVNTKFAVDRIIRHAYELAMRRDRKMVALVYKAALAYAGDLWLRTFEEVGAEYPSIERRHDNIEIAAQTLVVRPELYDVLVGDNAWGDILTDLTAALSGEIAFSSSSNLDPRRISPSVFVSAEMRIGSVRRANTLSTIRASAALMEWMDHKPIADRILAAMFTTANSGIDIYNASPAELGDSVIADLGA